MRDRAAAQQQMRADQLGQLGQRLGERRAHSAASRCGLAPRHVDHRPHLRVLAGQQRRRARRRRGCGPSISTTIRSASSSASAMSWVTIERGEAEPVVQVAIGAAERVAGDRIERAERLVHQHQLRPRRQRPRDADPLRLAAGKLRADSAPPSRPAARPARAARRVAVLAPLPDQPRARSRYSRRRSCAGTGRSSG